MNIYLCTLDAAGAGSLADTMDGKGLLSVVSLNLLPNRKLRIPSNENTIHKPSLST